MTPKQRLFTFLGIAAAALLLASIAVMVAIKRESRSAGQAPPAALAPPLDPAELLDERPRLLFRRTTLDQDNGSLAVAPLDRPDDIRLIRPLQCERVHMAAGRGVCLTADRGVITTYGAVLFDESFQQRATLPLAGVPSRTQVAPDGRLAGITVFVTGHSYSGGGFSTRTSLVDLEAGQWLVEDLETFKVLRDGREITSPDFNFWGVTFTHDSRIFYATLGTGGQTFLIKGDVQARTATVIADEVECPSISPDDRRIAFKKRESGGVGPATWRIWVMELDSMRRHALAETRNVDDQVQWLDAERVLYALPGEGQRAAIMDEWTVPADGSGSPELVLSGAFSAGLIRR